MDNIGHTAVFSPILVCRISVANCQDLKFSTNALEFVGHCHHNFDFVGAIVPTALPSLYL